MRKCFAFVCLPMVIFAHSARAELGLTVVFVQPESYSDASYSSSFANATDRADVQREIEQHLQRLALRALPPGDSLKIEVLDIDLAGRVEPFSSRIGNDARVVRDISWPRIELRYTLSHGDSVAPIREERISDLNYLSSFNRYSSGDRLRYEKAMLDRWFEGRFAKR